MVMDDEAFIREIITAELEDLGYRVIAASDGRELLERLATLDHKGAGTPGVRAAFLDLTVPGTMGGNQTVGRLREHHPDLPVFAFSGFSDNPVMARPRDFGFTDSLRKPYTKADLAALLSRYLTDGEDVSPHPTA